MIAMNYCGVEYTAVQAGALFMEMAVRDLKQSKAENQWGSGKPRDGYQAGSGCDWKSSARSNQTAADANGMTTIPRGTIIGKQVAPLSEAEHFWKCEVCGG
jgi:hypothetical protein